MYSQEQKDKAYKLAIAEQKAIRAKAHKSVITSHALLEETIEKFNNTERSCVNWEDLKAFPINEWVEIFKGVFAKKYYESETVIEFLTKMLPNTKFLWHEHEDCEEIAKVLIGELYEAVTETTYYEEEEVYYPAGFRHTPTNTGDVENLLNVKFMKIE